MNRACCDFKMSKYLTRLSKSILIVLLTYYVSLFCLFHRLKIDKLEEKLVIKPIDITWPSKELYATIPPVTIDNATYINSTRGLFMTLVEDYATMLRRNNYKVYLMLLLFCLVFVQCVIKCVVLIP